MKKIFDRVYVVTTAIVVCAAMILFIMIPDKDFSPAENRILEKAPRADIENIISGKFAEKTGVYIADQFPFRNFFVAAKAYSELALLRGENNGVIYGKNQTLIPRTENADVRLGENLDVLGSFSENTGAQVTVAALPRTIDVFSEYLPRSYNYEKDLNIWHELEALMEESNLGYVGLYDALCDSNSYYKTDHHYTTHGAYLVYTLLGDCLGYAPKEKDFFTPQTVTEDFSGTAMRTSGFYLVKRDSIDLFRYENDDRYSITADGKDIEIYDLSKLDTADKYAVFLGGNHARVDISDKTQERERLLIIRDSFADSIAPFLSLHYDLTMIDLRYYKESVAQLVKNEGISKVLVLESISELSTAKNISYLLME